MGLLSSSRSSSSSRNVETAGQFTDEAIGSVTSVGDIDNADYVKIETTDLGAVKLSQELASDALDKSLEFGESALQEVSGSAENSLEFGAGAMKLVADSATESLEFGAGVTESAFDRVGAATDDALKFGAGATQAAIEFGSGTVERSLESVDEAQANSYLFSAGVIGEQNEFVSDNVEQTINALEAARMDSLDFGAGTTQAFLADAESLRNRTFTVVDDVIDTIAGTTANTLSSLADAQSKTISAIGETAKSETTQSFDRLVKLTAGIFAGVAVLFIVLEFKN